MAKLLKFLLISFLLTTAAFGQFTVIPAGTGSSGGTSIDTIAWDAEDYFFPDTDPAGFSADGTEVKWSVILMAIGEEVQFKKRLTIPIGTSPQCGVSWYLPSGGPTTNSVRFDCKFACITDGESALSRALGSSNAGTDITVPGTAGLLSDDTWAASTDFAGCTEGDTMIVEFERLAATGTDISPATDVYAEHFWISWTN